MNETVITAALPAIPTCWKRLGARAAEVAMGDRCVMLMVSDVWLTVSLWLEKRSALEKAGFRVGEMRDSFHNRKVSERSADVFTEREARRRSLLHTIFHPFLREMLAKTARLANGVVLSPRPAVGRTMTALTEIAMTANDDLSPMSMARAAYTAAVAKMESQDKNHRVDVAALNRAMDSSDEGTMANRTVALFSESSKDNDATRASDAGARIDEIWKSGMGDAEVNLAEMLRLLVGELDSLMHCGLGAFYDLDTTTRQLAQSREFADTSWREAQRLQSVDEQSRASLSVSGHSLVCDVCCFCCRPSKSSLIVCNGNPSPEQQSLLRAVGSSKAEARDNSRSAQVEARLRTNISSFRDERDNALIELSDYRRKQSLLEEELRMTKANLSRITQEKIGMERDSRAAIFLARSLDNNNSNDMNYYKRKVGELSGKLQSQQDVIMKLNNTIAELRGQSERSPGEKRCRDGY